MVDSWGFGKGPHLCRLVADGTTSMTHCDRICIPRAFVFPRSIRLCVKCKGRSVKLFKMSTVGLCWSHSECIMQSYSPNENIFSSSIQHNFISNSIEPICMRNLMIIELLHFSARYKKTAACIDFSWMTPHLHLVPFIYTLLLHTGEKWNQNTYFILVRFFILHSDIYWF